MHKHGQDSDTAIPLYNGNMNKMSFFHSVTTVKHLNSASFFLWQDKSTLSLYLNAFSVFSAAHNSRSPSPCRGQTLISASIDSGPSVVTSVAG